MNYSKITKPDINLINECILMANTVNNLDKISHPILNVDEFYSHIQQPILYYAKNNDEIVSFIGVFSVSPIEIELCGFTLPDFRNKKIASTLLEMIFDDYSNCKIIIPIRSSSQPAKMFLESYDASYENTECIMELSKGNYASKKTLSNIKIQWNNEDDTYYAYLNNTEIGKVSVYKDKIYTINNVEIYQTYRGKGYGKTMVDEVINLLLEECSKIILHVTKENLPAFNLYKTLGFKVIDQLEYYSL